MGNHGIVADKHLVQLSTISKLQLKTLRRARNMLEKSCLEGGGSRNTRLDVRSPVNSAAPASGTRDCSSRPPKSPPEVSPKTLPRVARPFDQGLVWAAVGQSRPAPLFAQAWAAPAKVGRLRHRPTHGNDPGTFPGRTCPSTCGATSSCLSRAAQSGEPISGTSSYRFRRPRLRMCRLECNLPMFGLLPRRAAQVTCNTSCCCAICSSASLRSTSNLFSLAFRDPWTILGTGHRRLAPPATAMCPVSRRQTWHQLHAHKPSLFRTLMAP